MSQNTFSAQWTQTQNFYAYVDNNGNIVTQTMQGNQIVGVTLSKHKQIEQIAEQATAKAEEYKQKSEEYRTKLVEAGIIQEPLSEQEQIAQLSQQVMHLTQMIQDMQKTPNNTGATNELSKSIVNSTNDTAEQSIKRENNPSTTTSEPVPAYKGRSLPINGQAQYAK